MSTLDTDHPKIIGLGRSKYLAAPLSFFTAAVGPRRSPPQAAREAAQGGNGGRRPKAEGGAAAKGGGASASTKRGGAIYRSFFNPRLGAIARAAGRVRPVKPTAAGARRAITIQRAAPTTLPRRGIRRARTALGCFGRGNAEAAYVFLIRAGRVVREMFL